MNIEKERGNVMNIEVERGIDLNWYIFIIYLSDIVKYLWIMEN